MPRSKHRRKPGAKAVTNPGRGKDSDPATARRGSRALIELLERGPLARKIEDLDPDTLQAIRDAKVTDEPSG